MRQEGETPAGKVDVRIDVHEGRIRNVAFLGNFASKRDVGEVVEHLVGLRYERGALETAVSDLNFTPYFGEISIQEFVELLY